MNFYLDGYLYADAHICHNETYEGELALFYRSDKHGMSVPNFLRLHRSRNPELVHYLQLHYPEYLL
jgi:hypothetical protein